ncbi:hypothetical protein LIER_32919 [Lithospermum erythrorhizon]|uniref:Aminotransferase-like plant mobile domain-containing protein n=1 Tax=Lithospermum erythrorhizon TaxID=34254 RepID=A0AAV3RV61_LITER
MPGGPTDPEVLIGFQTHVATRIWEDSGFSGVLKGHTRLQAGERWNIGSSNQNRECVRIVNLSGLQKMWKLMFQTPNMALITTFFERWQPKTNIFHMPFGEMTITFYDVNAILGLNINDLAISGETHFQDDELLPKIRTRPNNKNSAFLNSMKVACDDPNISQQSVVSGYTWYLLGSMLFPDKTQVGIPSNTYDCCMI